MISSFSKILVFEIFSVHTKTPAFSNPSGLLRFRDGLVWKVGSTESNFFVTITAEISRAHRLNFIVGKRTDI